VKNEKCFAPLRLKAFERQYYLKNSRGDGGDLSLRKIRQELFFLSISLGESENLVNFASK
jgi:hypothetical protein